jgi:hypothetical protein
LFIGDVDKFWTNGYINVLLDKEISKCVAIYDSSNNLKFAINSDMHNPEEVASPCDFTVDETNGILYILDDYNPGIQLFSLKSGSYIGKIRTPPDIHCIEMVAPSYLLMYNNAEADYNPKENSTLYLYDTENKKMVDCGYMGNNSRNYMSFYLSGQVFFPNFSTPLKSLFLNEGVTDTIFELNVNNKKIQKTPVVICDFGSSALSANPPNQEEDAYSGFK